jgi:hypothetical protein
MSQQSPPQIPLPFQLSRMITSLWMPQAIHAAAALGIPDLLATGAKRSDDLAETVGAHAGALHRLMRGLVALGLCTATEDGAFELTPLGDCLRSDARDSVRSWALLMGGEMVWRSWGQFLECVRTGEPAPKLLDGMDAFEHIEANPAAAAVFDKSMVELTRHLGGAIAMSYDFTGISKLIDVGGGYGALLPPILKANPTMRGAVFDMAHCRAGAEQLFGKVGLGDRFEFISGSFFESVPGGADAYLMKSVIHDWDDERSLAILRNCRAAMRGAARFLLVEVIVPEQIGASLLDAMIASTDLNMLVNTGGCERTEAAYRKLLEAADLRVEQIVATPAAFSIIDARIA